MLEKPAVQAATATSPPPAAQSGREIALYAMQMISCAAILLSIYRFVGARSVMWAIVTVAVVLQPGLKQSLAASLNRVAANLVGAAAGLAIGLILGDSAWQFLLALAVVIFLCWLLHLSQSLRAACVTVTIVMLTYEGHLVSSSVERTTSVIAGCVLAVTVQYLTGFLRGLKTSRLP